MLSPCHEASMHFCTVTLSLWLQQLTVQNSDVLSSSAHVYKKGAACRRASPASYTTTTHVWATTASAAAHPFCQVFHSTSIYFHSTRFSNKNTPTYLLPWWRDARGVGSNEQGQVDRARRRGQRGSIILPAVLLLLLCTKRRSSPPDELTRHSCGGRWRLAGAAATRPHAKLQVPMHGDGETRWRVELSGARLRFTYCCQPVTVQVTYSRGRVFFVLCPAIRASLVEPLNSQIFKSV
jgi:hypothetical protein